MASFLESQAHSEVAEWLPIPCVEASWRGPARGQLAGAVAHGAHTVNESSFARLLVSLRHLLAERDEESAWLAVPEVRRRYETARGADGGKQRDGAFQAPQAPVPAWVHPGKTLFWGSWQ